MTDEDQPTRSELEARVEELERSAAVDQRLIEHLEAEGVVDRTKIENMEHALITCRRIGAAIGILMTTDKITENQAFDLLRAASQRSHRKLRDIADDVIVTGTVL